MLNILLIPLTTHILSVNIIINNRELGEKIVYLSYGNWLINFIFLHT